ncbi:glia maturation factor beta-like [Artemia franciscana]|uniref:ADF-H domain-containing protein n=1 Tax=Artemia franciscana TaxID=6661 RepID=A0AA88L463_ARTSF|nr:hypothetical protein QYM36_015006 [Artemia franciscana]
MATHVNVCQLTPEVVKLLKNFRFRKASNSAAIILKVNRENQEICVDEELEDIELEDLQNALPSHQPRFVLFSSKVEHGDGRFSYPLVFIFVTPRDCQPELMMMYAGTKLSIVREMDLTKVYEIRDVEELTEEWLLSKLVK